MRPAVVLLTFVIIHLLADQASAGLIGSTVNSTYYFPSLGSPDPDTSETKKVSPTAAFLVYGLIGETVTDTQIIIVNSSSFSNSGTFNGPIFDFLNSGTLITGVTVNAATNVSGFTASRITLLTDDAGGQLIEVNLKGLPFQAGLNVTLDVATKAPAPAAPPPAAAVPEPASVTLFAMLAGTTLYGWRRGWLRATSC